MSDIAQLSQLNAYIQNLIALCVGIPLLTGIVITGIGTIVSILAAGIGFIIGKLQEK